MNLVLTWIIIIVVVLCINGLLASNASDIAQNKGYEKKKWFHMCFWLGPISYIIIAAMPDLKMREIAVEMLKLQKKTEKNVLVIAQTQVKTDADEDNTGKPIKAFEKNNTTTVQAKAVPDKDNTEETCVDNAKKSIKAFENYVAFGAYPQTESGNDQTPIEWLVLAREDNKALLLSRYGLDAQPYNTSKTETTWEKSTLRTWLNKDFMNRAFTANEKSAILLTNVDNSSSQGYSKWSTSGGNNTQDKIFLLSFAEANKYLGVTYDNSNNTNNTTSRVAPTAYAIAQGAWTSSSNKTADGQAAGWWWLRSPGSDQDYAASVGTGGSLSISGVDCDYYCVRPALLVDLDAGIF